MRTIKKLVLAGLACLTVTAVHAGTVKYNGYLANESGVSTAKTYPLPLNSYAIDQLSFQLNWATAAPAAVTFTDGSESTTTITVTSNTGISTTTASATLTVSTTALTGACITFFNGITSQMTCNSGSWRTDVSSDAAADIVTQINTQFSAIVSSNGLTSSIISSTSTATGILMNSYSFATNTSSLTVNGLTSKTGSFSGGQDGATLWIGNTQYKFGGNVNIGAAASNTATNLAAAIAASSVTTNITAASVGAIVSATSTVVGTQMNVSVYSSTQAALTIIYTSSNVTPGNATGVMTGGTNSAYTLVSGSATVISATNPFSPLTDSLGMPSQIVPTPMVALPVLYSTGSAQAIGGLAWGTTYYIIPVTQGSFGLATTSANAVAGKFITLTSSQTKQTADSFTVTPLAYSGTASGKFESSNDGTNWVQNTTLPLETFTGVYPSSSTVVDAGSTNYANVRFNLSTPPTTGGLILQIVPNGKNSGL